MPAMTRMMAVAAQRYGMIVRDQTGRAVAFFGEDSTPYGANPYSGADRVLRRPLSAGLTDEAFPWDHLQLLQHGPARQGRITRAGAARRRLPGPGPTARLGSPPIPALRSPWIGAWSVG